VSEVLPVAKLTGLDNCGQPKQAFADKIAAMSEAEFLKATETHIWLSAFADNKPRSDYHWQCDACYAEAIRRGDVGLYRRAWVRASA